MKLTIKFPNKDIVEIYGYEMAIERLTDIKEEDETVILQCEISANKVDKATGTPAFLIAFLETRNEKESSSESKHLPFGEMVKAGFSIVQPA